MGKWEMVRLGDVFLSIKNGASIKQGAPEGAGYPITRIETIADGKVNRNKMGYAGIKELDSYSGFVLNSEDILMSHINSVKHLGKTALYIKQKDEQIIHGMNLLRLMPNKQILNSVYANYYFGSNFFKRQIPKITKNSVNQSSFTVTALKELTMPLPPLEIQRKIADVLDRAAALIEKRKAQIEKLDLLIKSRFIEMFGDPVNNPKNWNKTALNEVTTKIGSGATPKGGRDNYYADGISLIRSMNIYNNRFEYSQLAYINDMQAKQLSNVEVKSNDVLLNITGASVARCCSVPNDVLPARVNQHVAIIRVKQDLVRPEYLCHTLTNNGFQKQLLDIASKGGATREAITKAQIEELLFPLPERNLQNIFVSFTNDVERIRCSLQISLHKFERTYNSLMQKCFRGEIF